MNNLFKEEENKNEHRQAPGFGFPIVKRQVSMNLVLIKNIII